MWHAFVIYIKTLHNRSKNKSVNASMHKMHVSKHAFCEPHTRRHCLLFCLFVCLFLIYTVLCTHLWCTSSLYPNTSHLLPDWCQRGSSSSPLSKLWMRPGNYSQISQFVMGQRTVNCSCNSLGFRGRRPNKVKK